MSLNPGYRELRDALQTALHDLNTPLSILQNSLEPIEHSPLTPEAQTAAITIRREVARLMAVSEDLYLKLRASEPEALQPAAELDLRALVQEQIEIVEEQHPTRSVGCRYLSGSARVKGERSVLESLVWVVLTGVLLRTEADVLVTLGCSADARRVVLSVCDEGPALEPERVAEVLAGQRPAGRGARAPRSFALGLGAGRSLLRRLGGELDVRIAEEPGGAVNRIELQVPAAEVLA